MSKPESKVIQKGRGQTAAEPGKAAEIESRANEVISHSVAAASLSPEARHLRICVAAYRLAEERGFAPGDEMKDWLAAEREVDGVMND